MAKYDEILATIGRTPAVRINKLGRTYSKPLVYTVKSTLVPDDDLLEYFCAENEKDVQHYR